jgi:hypothetical protein
MADWVWMLVVAATAVIAMALLVLAVVWARRRRESNHLRERFGPEYDRVVDRKGRDRGERELQARLRNHDALALRSISPEGERMLMESWTRIQVSFVDAPVTAVRDADQLVFETLRERGYPLESVDQRAAALSVDYPTLAARYRDAHEALADAQRGTRDVGRLHSALLTYRELLTALLLRTDLPGSATTETAASPVPEDVHGDRS